MIAAPGLGGINEHRTDWISFLDHHHRPSIATRRSASPSHAAKSARPTTVNTATRCTIDNNHMTSSWNLPWIMSGACAESGYGRSTRGSRVSPLSAHQDTRTGLRRWPIRAVRSRIIGWIRRMSLSVSSPVAYGTGGGRLKGPEHIHASGKRPLAAFGVDGNGHGLIERQRAVDLLRRHNDFLGARRICRADKRNDARAFPVPSRDRVQSPFLST